MTVDTERVISRKERTLEALLQGLQENGDNPILAWHDSINHIYKNERNKKYELLIDVMYWIPEEEQWDILQEFIDRGKELYNDKPKKILNFLYEYIQERDFGPSIQEVANGVDLHAPNAVVRHLNSLKDEGLVNFIRDDTRTLTITDKGLRFIA